VGLLGDIDVVVKAGCCKLLVCSSHADKEVPGLPKLDTVRDSAVLLCKSDDVAFLIMAAIYGLYGMK